MPTAGLEGRGISLQSPGLASLNAPGGNRDIPMGPGSRTTGVSSNSSPGGRHLVGWARRRGQRQQERQAISAEPHLPPCLASCRFPEGTGPDCMALRTDSLYTTVYKTSGYSSESGKAEGQQVTLQFVTSSKCD